jgi:hypothetical protein
MGREARAVGERDVMHQAVPAVSAYMKEGAMIRYAIEGIRGVGIVSGKAMVVPEAQFG